MNSIYNTITKIENLTEEVKKIYLDRNRYNLQENFINNGLQNLQKTINELKEGLYVIIEHPYVDKTYRDGYYKYFASKRDVFSRDTIRVSFFSKRVEEKDFRSQDKFAYVQKNYLGFIVLRPTFPHIIGRTVIRKECLKKENYITCNVKYNTTANGIKLNIKGFPHSSQDSETISCAETTVWSLLEYFGSKYPDYRPLLPSKINEVLGKFSTERLLPSNGLTAGQIAYSLKEFGFGVKIYSKNSYGLEFEKIIRVYIESGIPVVGVIQNNNGIGHAVNIIGRENVNEIDIENLHVTRKIDNNVNVFEFEELDINYCFVDDNYPPYQLTKLNNPASYYSSPKWLGCQITNIIVPLYPKIYLEAGEAKKIAFSVITQLKLLTNKNIIIKTFLASSRSFKNSIALNEELNDDAKELLLATSMPKFIWIMEITEKELVLEGLVSGMVIIDATEPKRLGIIAALIENTYIANDMSTFKKINIPLQPFTAYNKNLN